MTIEHFVWRMEETSSVLIGQQVILGASVILGGSLGLSRLRSSKPGCVGQSGECERIRDEVKSSRHAESNGQVQWPRCLSQASDFHRPMSGPRPDSETDHLAPCNRASSSAR